MEPKAPTLDQVVVLLAIVDTGSFAGATSGSKHALLPAGMGWGNMPNPGSVMT